MEVAGIELGQTDGTRRIPLAASTTRRGSVGTDRVSLGQAVDAVNKAMEATRLGSVGRVDIRSLHSTLLLETKRCEGTVDDRSSVEIVGGVQVGNGAGLAEGVDAEGHGWDPEHGAEPGHGVRRGVVHCHDGRAVGEAGS